MKKMLESLVRGADPKPISKPIIVKWFGGNLVVTGTEKQRSILLLIILLLIIARERQKK